MKLNKNSKTNYSGFGNGGILRVLCLAMLITFSMHVFILPALSALTVEEQAGKKNKEADTSGDDEFVKKTMSRRAPAGNPEAKDPRLACLLSLIIPGGGQIYLKKDIKGIAFFSLSVIGYSASGYYLFEAITGGYSGAEKKSKYVISGLFFLLGLIFHIVGIVEAYNDAIEINEKSFYYGGYSESPHIAELCIK